MRSVQAEASKALFRMLFELACSRDMTVEIKKTGTVYCVTISHDTLSACASAGEAYWALWDAFDAWEVETGLAELLG